MIKNGSEGLSPTIFELEPKNDKVPKKHVFLASVDCKSYIKHQNQVPKESKLLP